ncbi:hypothetical protein [Lentilitoribacter sp. Alg239-R112]|uniref:hypothetical protein n=1 Tax=Lentilitoribacter sp. Alg239-R112 TaxID=2305987 RepID=UPI0013A6D48F|nr:hypothetical protein [Lentilitoribacter sp. Alg239-R112]
MNALKNFMVALLLLLISANIAIAQEWQIHTGTDEQSGEKFASMSVRMHEFAFEFYCGEHDWQDYRLGAKLYGPPLPRLSAFDGADAKLSLLFTLRSGVLVRELWKPRYRDGGARDQVWAGSIYAGKSELDAISSALKLDVLNIDGELVYSFPTKGTSKGIAHIREFCKIGLE